MNIRSLLSLCLVLGMLSITSKSFGTTHYVTSSGSGSGTSWTDATDLHAALAAASAGDEIWVAAGVYKPAVFDRNESFVVGSGVSLYGGFSGTESLLEERDFLANRTILSGDLLDNDPSDLSTVSNRFDNSYEVVYCSDNSLPSTLDGFVVKSAFNSSSIYIYNSSMNIRNCLITANWGDNAGGGIAFREAFLNMVEDTLTLDNVYFIANKAQRGAGLAAFAGIVNMSNCVFRDNEAFHNGGAANFIIECSVNATNNRFINNKVLNISVPGGGGALYVNSFRNCSFSDCLFLRNQGSDGGAVYTEDTDIQFDRCLFSKNVSSTSGGAIYTKSGNPVFKNCGFLANETTGTSGGAGRIQGSATFANCVFLGNFAQLYTGGLHSGFLNIYNCTFSGNNSNLGNNAIWASSVNMFNSIVWGNDWGSPSFPSTVEYCLIEGGAIGPGNISADPLFEFTPDPLDAPSNTGNLNLVAGSPAINAGNDAAVPVDILTDANGNNRFVGTVDMGAFEFQGSLRAGTEESSELLSAVVASDFLQVCWHDFTADQIEIYTVAGQLVYENKLSETDLCHQVGADKLRGLNYVILHGPSGLEMQMVFVP